MSIERHTQKAVWQAIVSNWSDRIRVSRATGAVLGSADQTPSTAAQSHAAAQEVAMEVDALVHRVCAEFIEMPGLRLTLAQAARLWGLTPALCRTVVDRLIAAGFLRLTPTGMLIRADCE